MNTAKIGEFLLFIVPLLFSISFHEAAHAYLADKKGDSTARALGRVTLNPIPHLDLLGTIILPTLMFFYGGFLFGWAKPVPVNPMNLKDRKKDNLLISLAGPVSNLILAVAFMIGIKLVTLFNADAVYSYYRGVAGALDHPLVSLLDIGVRLNITLAVFNLIPLPPLDGSHILEGLLPDKYDALMDKYRQMSFFIFVVLLFTGILKVISYPIGIIYFLLIRLFL